ncbi:hypothetical protein FQN57_003345 [Myotisia sp. PD_48]|nr:hypothetical protein FQN57_003345 [Myotisia sp. PD_48]
MVFRNSFNEKLDEFGYSFPQSPPSDSAFSSFHSPAASQTGFGTTLNSFPAHDVRSAIHRRFTTDSSRLPQWTGYNSQPLKQPEQLDVLSSFEKKRQYIEFMKEQKRRFEADLKLLDLQQEREKQEMDQIARDLAQVGLTGGVVSEPTTPPEYRDPGFPTALSRPARFSISNGHSPSPFAGVFSPSSQVTSPSSTSQMNTAINQPSNNEFAIRAGMAHRRNSEQAPSGPFSAFRGNHMNRYSVSSVFGPPISSTASRNRGFSNSLGFGALLSHKNPLEDEEDKPKDEERMSTPDVKSYLRMTDPDDRFPTPMRANDNPSMLSSNSTAIDLTNSRTPVPENFNGNTRHHAVHHSLPQNSFSSWLGGETMDHPQSNNNMNGVTAGNFSSSRHISRPSMDSNVSELSSASATSYHTNNNSLHSRPTSLQLSYSTNDIPHLSNGGFQHDSVAMTPIEATHSSFPNFSAMSSNGSSANTTPPTPQSSDREEQGSGQQFRSSFQLNGAAHSSAYVSSSIAAPSINGSVTPTASTFATSGYGYGMQVYAPNAHQLNGNPAAQGHSFPGGYGAQGYQVSRFAESPRTNQGRRSGDSDSQLNRFGNLPLDTYSGELYGMCKDQHGCRYLQRQLEEGTPDQIQTIFLETHMHVVELMTDPFGNYLCQKLLEFTNDEQRTVLINNAAPHLVQIALNQHGTRALQKMIEFVSTPEQIETVINALSKKVVDLVQDLNGNHVIQKCLNRLAASDAQFIFDAVGKECVAVGTHRHGCCVLQRCIDHASGDQRARLIQQITKNAYALVQDPFGNYVIQYILDLAEPHFTGPLCATFQGSIPILSKQKFSSNVIEKCIRTSDYSMRCAFIHEIVQPQELHHMLRDSFANYVVQTAIDFADPESRNLLIEAIRPLLPSIRSQPHGRRIAGKIMTLDTHARTNPNGPIPGAPLGLDEVRGGFQQPYTLPNQTTANQFGSQYSPQENSASTAPSGQSATSDSDLASICSPVSETGNTTIFSPVPQHMHKAITGMNGLNGTNPHGFNMF